jgi:hypothetical protein
MDYGHFYQLKILKERMGENLKCIKCPPNLGQWIQIKSWLCGSLIVAFIHILNIPCYASNPQQSNNDATNELEPPNPKSFGS